MDSSVSFNIHLDAFSSLLKSLIHAANDEQLKDIQKHLEHLWDGVEKQNTNPAISEKLIKSRELALSITEDEMKMRSLKKG
jgi:hypothetical protein